MGELNDRGVPVSCETDVGSAVIMRAMYLASEKPAACLEWTNNYGDDPNKVILSHCGPVSDSLMITKGNVTDHRMFAKNKPGCGWGCNEGRIAAFPMTYGHCKTENGKIMLYLGEGAFTGEPIEPRFFGCAGVAMIDDLQAKLHRIATKGYRHHVVIGVGHISSILREALVNYLDFELDECF
jgi:L-fucose isomerase-like protein